MTVESREVFRPPVPFESVDLTPFQNLPAAARSRQLFEADALIDAVVNRWCSSALVTLGMPPDTLEGSVADLAAGAGVVPDQVASFEWILQKLAGAGVMELSGEVVRPGEGRVWSADALARAIEPVAPGLGSTFELLEEIGRNYPDCLRGRVNGSTLLFNREAIERWARYFSNDNLSYAAINWIAAAAADEASEGSSLRVLEVGGGFGSGAEALLDRVAGRIDRYCFSEVSPLFLVRGKARLEERFPGLNLEHARIDLNRPLAAQGVDSSSFDLIYAVNTLHAVRDLLSSLRGLATRLRPGGVLVLGEGIRPRPGFPVPMEFVFQLTKEFDEIQPESFRRRGGFLFFEDWRTALLEAGFSRVRFVPELGAAVEAYPAYTLAAMVAVKE